MTKNKWWALEVIFGIAALVGASPLPWQRYLFTVACITLFAVCYAQRLIAQGLGRKNIF
jgi:hypothetical protein